MDNNELYARLIKVANSLDHANLRSDAHVIRSIADRVAQVSPGMRLKRALLSNRIFAPILSLNPNFENWATDPSAQNLVSAVLGGLFSFMGSRNTKMSFFFDAVRHSPLGSAGENLVRQVAYSTSPEHFRSMINSPEYSSAQKNLLNSYFVYMNQS